jgi:cytochrome c
MKDCQKRVWNRIAREISLAAIIFAGASHNTAAQPGSDPKVGHALAERLCASCHVIGGEPRRDTMLVDVPSFAVIANKKDQTIERIAGRIVVPHPPMPQVQLTRAEIAALSTYIYSLREP